MASIVVKEEVITGSVSNQEDEVTGAVRDRTLASQIKAINIFLRLSCACSLALTFSPHPPELESRGSAIEAIRAHLHADQ